MPPRGRRGAIAYITRGAPPLGAAAQGAALLQAAARWRVFGGGGRGDAAPPRRGRAERRLSAEAVQGVCVGGRARVRRAPPARRPAGDLATPLA